MRYIFILLAVLCTSCGTALPTIKPYKLDVQQGNVVTSKMLLQLRPGMTKPQVRFIMGTPLIQDSFHGNRWDYVYQLREGGKIIEQRRVILDFENELLRTVRGDVVPSGGEQPKSGEGSENTGARVLKPYAKPEEKSFLRKLKFWEKDEAVPVKETAKAKTTADEAKKKEVAPVKEIITPAVEEPKSILAVPVEVLPTPEASAPIVPDQAPAVAVPAQEIPEADLKPVAPAPVKPIATDAIMESTQDAAQEATLSPVEAPSHEIQSGMKFDRTLRVVPEEVEPVAKPVAVAPRAGNKTPPKPNDLPAEGSPGFFDRMLEKIGF